MPSSLKAKKALTPYVRGKIVDLGAGWGTLLATFPKNDCLGIEISPLPYWISRLRGLPVIRKDFFEFDLSQFDTIVCYLYPGAMTKLKAKFERELKPGTIVISNTFAVPGWTPTEVIELDDLYRSKLLFYRI